MKLQDRQLRASHQLAHVVNRMFTVLETKGILRTATEEFMLAAKYHAQDPLSAECIRTCRHQDFPGNKFLERVESIARAIMPFLMVEIATIFLVTYFPAISMTLPRLTGFVD